MVLILVPSDISADIDPSSIDLESTKVFHRTGKAPSYLIIDTETKVLKIVANTNHHFGGKQSTADIAQTHQAESMVASHAGEHMYEGFQAKGIPIYEAERNTPLSKLIQAVENKDLPLLTLDKVQKRSHHKH